MSCSRILLLLPEIKRSPATYVCGCLNNVEETGASLLPFPPRPPPRPGECGCSGSSGRAGSCSAYRRLQIKRHSPIRNYLQKH